MAAANIISSLFNVIIFIYLARALMPEALGYLSYAFTLVFFLANFVDLGLSTYGIREVAKDKARMSDYVSEIVSFRLIIAGVLAAALFISVSFSRHLGILKILVLESSLLLFIFGFATEWAFQGAEKMHMVFISFATTSALQFLLIYTFVKTPADLSKVPILYFVAALPIILIFLTRLRFKLRIKRMDLQRIVIYLSSSLVIWSISIFAQIYNNFDIFILGIFRKIEEVGYFTIARRIIGGAALLMVFLANAVLPRLSHAFCNDIAQFKAATQKFLKISIILTLFILLPVIFFSKEFILLTVGSQYLPVSTPLRIMFVGFGFILFNLPYSTGLIAGGLEKEVLKQAAASAMLSITSNFILIPKYGMIGAAISFSMAEALALSWILWIYGKRVRSLI